MAKIESIIKAELEDRGVHPIGSNICVERQPLLMHKYGKLWRPDTELGSNRQVDNKALQGGNVRIGDTRNRRILLLLFCPIDDGIAAVVVADGELEKFPNAHQRKGVDVLMAEEWVARLEKESVAVSHVIAQLLIRGAASLCGKRGLTRREKEGIIAFVTNCNLF